VTNSVRAPEGTSKEVLELIASLGYKDYLSYAAKNAYLVSYRSKLRVNAQNEMVLTNGADSSLTPVSEDVADLSVTLTRRINDLERQISELKFAQEMMLRRLNEN